MKIAMVDQDGVVCGTDYLTNKDITATVRTFETAGNLIVPNSNTPAERLIANFHEMIGSQTKIAIAENGAVVQIGSGLKFIRSVIGINEYRLALQSLINRNGCRSEVGDSATWVKMRKKFKPNSRYILIDGGRRQSVGIYLLASNKEGHLFLDQEWALEALNIISVVKLPEGLGSLEYNNDYGIAIAVPRGIKKEDGLLLLSDHFPNAEFFMVGDSDSDIINHEGVTHCAVANASDGLKSKSQFIAKKPLTAGLEECLQWILTRS